MQKGIYRDSLLSLYLSKVLYHNVSEYVYIRNMTFLKHSQPTFLYLIIPKIQNKSKVNQLLNYFHTIKRGYLLLIFTFMV